MVEKKFNEIITELDNRIEKLEIKSQNARNINIESNMNFQIEALKDFKVGLISE